MKSHEGITQASGKLEREGEELPTSSFEDVGADISNEHLAEYAHTSEMQVQEEATEIVPEGEKRIEATAQGMNVSPEMLNETKQEFGLDTKLQEVQSEADQIVAETKSEIVSVMGSSPLKESIDKKETPKEQERRRVYDNLRDDPTYRFLDKEITKRTNLDGQVMSAMQFGRDYSGVWNRVNIRESLHGLNRFVEANPEKAGGYAERWKKYVSENSEVLNMNNTQWEKWCDTHEEAYSMSEYRRIAGAVDRQKKASYAENIKMKRGDETGNSFSRGQEKIADLDTSIFKISEPQSPQEGYNQTGEISRIFEKAGISSKVFGIEDSEEFPEAVIFEKQEVPREKLVRIFRGINHLDGSLLEQVPYAMRSENEIGVPTIIENVKVEVERLAEEPTYENLLAYAEKVRPFLKPKEVSRLNSDIVSIEEQILGGMSTRKALFFDQIKHHGGWGESGISPYVSASFDPYEATGYGKGGLMVLDVPLSEIADPKSGNGEIRIKGTLDKKYITAVIPRKTKRQGGGSKDETNKQLYQTLLKVYEATDAPLLDAEELRSMCETKSVEVAVLDKNQWEKDVAVVRQKRIRKLTRRFPEVEPNMQAIQEKSIEEGVDVYTGVKRYVFDQYKSRLGKIGRNGRDISEYDFSTSQYGERKKFDRESVTDVMLLKLRELVDRLEEREEEREKSRNGK